MDNFCFEVHYTCKSCATCPDVIICSGDYFCGHYDADNVILRELDNDIFISIHKNCPRRK